MRTLRGLPEHRFRRRYGFHRPKAFFPRQRSVREGVLPDIMNLNVPTAGRADVVTQSRPAGPSKGSDRRPTRTTARPNLRPGTAPSHSPATRYDPELSLDALLADCLAESATIVNWHTEANRQFDLGSHPSWLAQTGMPAVLGVINKRQLIKYVAHPQRRPKRKGRGALSSPSVHRSARVLAMRLLTETDDASRARLRPRSDRQPPPAFNPGSDPACIHRGEEGQTSAALSQKPLAFSPPNGSDVPPTYGEATS